MMRITDVDKNLNSKAQFKIEVNHVWYTVDAVDFFDFLAETQRIDGHDPENESAWIQSGRMRWCAYRQKPVEADRPESRSYQSWIEDFVDQDEVLIEYMTASQIVKSDAISVAA